MQTSSFIHGQLVLDKKFSDAHNALLFAAGSFLFMVILGGAGHSLFFLGALALFELFPITYAYLQPTRARLFVKDNFLTIEKEYLPGRQKQLLQYQTSQLRDFHLLKTAPNRHSSVTLYSLCFTDSRGDSVALLPSMTKTEVDKVTNLLAEHIEQIDAEQELDARYISIQQLARQYGWILASILLFPVVGAIGMASMQTQDTKVKTSESLPIELSSQQQQLVNIELQEACGGKRYCIIGFFATWCSTSSRSQFIMPALRAYFSGRNEVGIAEFTRSTSWGQPGAEKDEWQRDIQRTLRLGFEVPGFAVLENGKTIQRLYTGGINSSNVSAEEFVRTHLKAPYLFH